ncbi:MAG: PilN domain-containing protein [Vicinamibacterales bacterium]
MIRINLLRAARAPERARIATPGAAVPLVCAVVLLAAAGGIAWWYWSLARQGEAVAAELATARQEAERLRGVIAEVTQFERRQAQLRERVDLIEQLRANQSVPVRLVDAVSRSLPDMLWLTHMKQTGPDLLIEGRSTTLIALSDLVGNLGNSPVFERPVELVDSQVEPAGPGGASTGVQELIRFSVKARLAGFQPQAAPAAPAAAGPGRAGGR